MRLDCFIIQNNDCSTPPDAITHSLIRAANDSFDAEEMHAQLHGIILKEFQCE